jgi:hypothetical protein
MIELRAVLIDELCEMTISPVPTTPFEVEVVLFLRGNGTAIYVRVLNLTTLQAACGSPEIVQAVK